MKSAIRISALLFLYSCSGGVHPTISGKLDFGSDQAVVLSKITESGEVRLDSATTDGDGNFELRNAASGTDYYLLRTGPKSVIYLVLDGSEDVRITGDARELESTYSVEGSPESELLRKLRSTDRQLTDSFNRTFAGMRDMVPMQRDSAAHELETRYTRSMREYAREMIREHPGSLASLSATKFLDQSNDLELMQLLADSLYKRHQGNPYVEDYRRLVSELRMLPPGSTAPPIELKTPEGRPVTLDDFKGKVLLVDFWASWCAPCRRANPDLKRLYDKHRADAFAVLGVSLDDNPEAWKQAIRQDALPWTQVSELKKWDSKCVKDYHIEAIPFSVLLDRDGKILAKGLEPEQLEPIILEALHKKR
jgi:thiol-disulfide isomerase/thioredoxin